MTRGALRAVETGKRASMSIQSHLPPELSGRVDQRLSTAADERVSARIWDRDGTLWAPEGTPEVTNRLGWLDIADRMSEQLDELQRFAESVHSAGYTDAVLL